MARKYSIIARTEDETFDELDWSITIADDRAEADRIARDTLADDAEVVEVGIGEYDDDNECGDCGIGNICLAHIVGVFPEPEGMSYQDACAQAATVQGLDPLAEALTAADIPFRIEQTGGYEMHLRIYNPGVRTVLDFTFSGARWRLAEIDNWREPGIVFAETANLGAVVVVARARAQPAEPSRDSLKPGPSTQHLASTQEPYSEASEIHRTDSGPSL